MGGGQANKGQATTAANQQTAANSQDMALSASNAARQKQLTDTLFGTGTPGSSGTLSGMLDPKSLNTGAPEGSYKTAWNDAENKIGSNFANERGSLARSFANMGATPSSTPNGFQADQMNKLGRGEADTRGSTYTGIVGQQHADALNNFWNASNIASGNAATSGAGALQGAGQSGSSSAQLYGTAGAYHPGQVVPAIGQVGAAAAQCPATGSAILMHDRSLKKVEDLKKGDRLMGIDGEADELLDDPLPAQPNEVLFIQTKDFACTVSQAHTFVRPEGGYMFAGKCVGRKAATLDGEQPVLSAEMFPDKLVCWRLFLSRSHTYNVGGIWSME